jgi:hypothetical protein
MTPSWRKSRSFILAGPKDAWTAVIDGKKAPAKPTRPKTASQ